MKNSGKKISIKDRIIKHINMIRVISENPVNHIDLISKMAYDNCPHIRNCKACFAEGTDLCKYTDIEPPKPTYEGEIILGVCSGYDSGNEIKEGELVRIKIGKGTFLLVVGQSGSGKSFLMRRIIDMLAMNKTKMMIACDPKNQYISSQYPNKYERTKFYGIGKNYYVGHMEKEQMYSHRMKFYIGRYVKVHLDNHLPEDIENCIPIAFPIKAYSSSALMQLMELDKKYHHGILQKAITSLKLKNKNYTVKDFINEIDIMENMDKNTKRSMKQKIEMLEILGLVDDNADPKVFFRDIEEGVVPVIVYKHGYSSDMGHLMDGFADAILKSVYDYQTRSKEMPPLWLIMDESKFLIPRVRNPPSKKTVSMIMEMGRSAGMSVGIALQYTEQIDTNILESDFNYYITFKPMNEADMNLWRMKLKGSDAEKPSLEKLNKLKFKKNSMNEAALIDSQGRMITFWPFRPLSKHCD